MWNKREYKRIAWEGEDTVKAEYHLLSQILFVCLTAV